MSEASAVLSVHRAILIAEKINSVTSTRMLGAIVKTALARWKSAAPTGCQRMASLIAKQGAQAQNLVLPVTKNLSFRPFQNTIKLLSAHVFLKLTLCFSDDTQDFHQKQPTHPC